MASYVILAMIQLAAFAVVFAKNKKWVALLLWLIGLFQGVVFLLNGSEILALLQWIQSSVFSLLMLIYLVILGDGREDADFKGSAIVVPAFLSAGFGYTLYSGIKESGAFLSLLDQGNIALRLGDLGRELMQKHFLLVPALTLFSLLAIVGVGQMTRPEEKSR